MLSYRSAPRAPPRGSRRSPAVPAYRSAAIGSDRREAATHAVLRHRRPSRRCCAALPGEVREPRASLVRAESPRARHGQRSRPARYRPLDARAPHMEARHAWPAEMPEAGGAVAVVACQTRSHRHTSRLGRRIRHPSSDPNLNPPMCKHRTRSPSLPLFAHPCSGDRACRCARIVVAAVVLSSGHRESCYVASDGGSAL